MGDARRLADEFAALLPYSVFGPEERKAFADEVCSRLAPLDSPIIAAAPEMEALLLEFRDAFKPGEYIEDGQLDDLAIRVRTLLSGLDAEKGGG